LEGGRLVVAGGAHERRGAKKRAAALPRPELGRFFRKPNSRPARRGAPILANRAARPLETYYSSVAPCCEGASSLLPCPCCTILLRTLLYIQLLSKKDLRSPVGPGVEGACRAGDLGVGVCSGWGDLPGPRRSLYSTLWFHVAGPGPWRWPPGTGGPTGRKRRQLHKTLTLPLH